MVVVEVPTLRIDLHHGLRHAHRIEQRVKSLGEAIAIKVLNRKRSASCDEHIDRGNERRMRTRAYRQALGVQEFIDGCARRKAREGRGEDWCEPRRRHHERGARSISGGEPTETLLGRALFTETVANDINHIGLRG